jgi:PAS domain S-box-containing protein
VVLKKSQTPQKGPFEDTESIDVTTLATEVTSSGSFDVSQFKATSFSKLLQALPVPALLIDESHRIVFANQSCSKINPDPEKLLGSPAAEMALASSASKKIQSLLEDVFSTRMPQTCDAVLGPAETGLWGRLFFRSVRLDQTRMTLLVVEDLTFEKKQLLLSQKYRTDLEKEVAERKRAEEALAKVNRELEDRIRQRTRELLELNEHLKREIGEREYAQKLLSDSQQRLELALKGADLGSWDYDIANNEAFVDQNWAEIFGYSLEDIPPSISWWRSVLHPEDRSAVIEAWNAHLEGISPFFEAEHRVKAKSGDWNWVLTRGKVVDRDKDGKPLRASGTAFNISDRKRAEDKLLQMSKVFMESIDPIFIRDLEGYIVDLNKAAEETYGWSREQLIGQSMKKIVCPDKHGIGDALHERCKGGEKVENVETFHCKRSGEVIPVLVSLSLLTDRKNEPVGIASITKNLSDLKRTEAMLRAKTEALERSNKDLEEFAYIAAHDLREPLVGIAAYLKVLERICQGKLDSEAHKLVSRSLDITLRMDSLVQSLLAYSRLGAGPKSFQPTDCNMALQSALSNLRSAIEGTRAKVTSDPLPTVMGDPALMIQLFQNLVSNAMKFAADRPLEIHVGATREETKWQFHVKDNGIGIEPPHFDRIFRIFQRIETSGGRAGTGIGLANCKKIVEHHGGRIWVESVPGEGSTFFFTVPERAHAYP